MVTALLIMGMVLCSTRVCLAKTPGQAPVIGHGAGQPEEFQIEEPERKDPFVAGLMSWAWPGLGQFYAQDYTMGSFFLLTSMVQKGLLVYLLFYYSDKYTSRGGDIVTWQDMEARDKTIIIGYIFSILFVKVACVVNAVYSAESYNKNTYFPYWRSKNRVRFSVEVESNRLSIALTRPL